MAWEANAGASKVDSGAANRQSDPVVMATASGGLSSWPTKEGREQRWRISRRETMPGRRRVNRQPGSTKSSKSKKIEWCGDTKNSSERSTVQRFNRHGMFKVNSITENKWFSWGVCG